MPRVTNAQLTLPRNGANVTINIAYDAVFSAFERHCSTGIGVPEQ